MPSKIPNPLILASLTFCLIFSACSFWPFINEPDLTENKVPTLEETPASPQNISRRRGSISRQPRQSTKPAIEIIWKSTESSADSYILTYGPQESELTNTKNIAASDLEIKADPEHGQVYRYVMDDAEPGKDLYFSISAMRGTEQSEPSNVMRIPGNVTQEN